MKKFIFDNLSVFDGLWSRTLNESNNKDNSSFKQFKYWTAKLCDCSEIHK